MLAAGIAPAQEAPILSVGDPAPAFDIAYWVKGQKLDAFAPDGTYVMEFWATWCPPCRASIPHLSELQERYAGKITFIGVSDEDLDTVKTFLDQPEWQGKSQYTLCADPDRSTHKAWMEAAGQTGIPTAFVVQKGHIQWIGHPMELDPVLEEVLAGTWSVEAYKKELVLRERLNELGESFQKATEEERQQILEEVLAVMDQIVETAPKRNGQLLLSMFQIRIGMMGQPEEAWKLAPRLLKTNWDNAMVLNQFAWLLATDEGIQDRHLDMALKAARRATELTKNENPDILDTLARVHFVRGEKDEAVRWEQKAVDLAEDPRQKQAYQDNLDEFRGGSS